MVLGLLIAGFVLFVLATIGIPSPPRFSLQSAGLACWILAEIIGHGLLH